MTCRQVMRVFPVVLGYCKCLVLFSGLLGLFLQISPVNKELFKPNSATIREFTADARPLRWNTLRLPRSRLRMHTAAVMVCREKKLNQFYP